jgi:hypothetical protein
MNIYGMNSLSEVFGGKIIGLNAPVKFENEEISFKGTDVKSPFKEPTISTKGNGFEQSIIGLKGKGFENTVMSLKGKGFNNIQTPSSSNIESKIFGNFKNNNKFFNPISLGIKNNVGGVSGFEQALYGSRVGQGRVFNDFITRNRVIRSVKTPVGKLQVVTIPKGGSSVPTQIVQNQNLETYGETYGKPGIIETAEKLGRGIVTVGKATGKAVGAIGTGLGKTAKAVGEGTGFIESPEVRTARIEQEKALLQLRSQILAQQQQQQLMTGYNPYGMVSGAIPMGYNVGFGQPINYGMPTGLGMMGSQGFNIVGPQTLRSPQQKVIEGYGMGITGGVSPENIRFAAGVAGGGWDKIAMASFLPQNEPYSNKVIQSLSPTKTVRPYTDVVRESLIMAPGSETAEDKIMRYLGKKKPQEGQIVQPSVQKVIPYQREYYKQEELPGGPTYPRPTIYPQPAPLIPIPQKSQPQIMQLPQQQTQQQQFQQQPQQTRQAGSGEQVVYSPYSKKRVTYVRGPYRERKKVQYTQQPVQQQYMQPQNAQAVYNY